MPQAEETKRLLPGAYSSMPWIATTATLSTTAASMGNERNWHSTQSCVKLAVAVKWPWQLWCTQSVQVVSVVDGVL